MRLRTRQILFSSIVLGLVFISCQFSPSNILSGFQKNKPEVEQTPDTKNDSGFFQKLLPDWLTGTSPKSGIGSPGFYAGRATRRKFIGCCRGG
jgi:hypothetical protein